MRAIDVMVREVITVHPDTDVAEAIKLLSEHDVSALPVVDAHQHLVGVISGPTCFIASKSALRSAAPGGSRR